MSLSIFLFYQVICFFLHTLHFSYPEYFWPICWNLLYHSCINDRQLCRVYCCSHRNRNRYLTVNFRLDNFPKLWRLQWKVSTFVHKIKHLLWSGLRTKSLIASIFLFSFYNLLNYCIYLKYSYNTFVEFKM